MTRRPIDRFTPTVELVSEGRPMPATPAKSASVRLHAAGGEPVDRRPGWAELRDGRRSASGRLVLEMDSYRADLRHHCGRILGSSFEADDAVQETLVRAWRAVDRFDGRSSLRTWLYAIATNVCLSMRMAPQRRARPFGVAVTADAAEATEGCPADTVAEREEVRLAFVVALNRLPPRQRAVLVLRDALGWRAAEVAELLSVTVVSVNSALQRARSTLGAERVAGEDLDQRPARRGRMHHQRLARCVVALERCDASELAALLGGAGQAERARPAEEGRVPAVPLGA